MRDKSYIISNLLILCALVVILLFTLMIVLSFVNITIMGDEYEITEKCIDNAGFEFKDQYCEGKVKCGPILLFNNQRCNDIDVNVANSEQGGKDVV